jgi:hypothetical protein
LILSGNRFLCSLSAFGLLFFKRNRFFLLFTGSLTGSFVSITAFLFLISNNFPEPFLYNWLFCRGFCFSISFAATIGGTSGVELTALQQQQPS